MREKVYFLARIRNGLVIVLSGAQEGEEWREFLKMQEQPSADVYVCEA